MKTKYYMLTGISAAAAVLTGGGLASAGWFDQKPGHGIVQAKHQGHKQAQGFIALFRATDTDKDRRISIEEVSEMLKTRFSALDGNADGQIDLDEFSARHLKLFSAIDSNADGMVTRQEIHAHRHQENS